MAHPIYNRQQLLNRGLVKVKSVAADLGVIPTGDKRLIQSWVDAIIEHQAALVQEVQLVEAVIDFDDDCYEGLTEPYVVLVGGKVVHRTATYQQAVRHCKWKGYTLLDSQTLAQQELEVELEVQAATIAEKAASVEVLEQHTEDGFVKFVVVNHENGNHYTVTPGHPDNRQRCECGDNHFRGTECKHQIAVKNEIASRISFISPTNFGYYEAIVNNDVHHVIGTIEYFSSRDCDQPWWNAEMAKQSKTLASYEEAEQFIKDKYVEDILMNGRGSGRIEPVIEDMGYQIEDIHYQDDRGSQYLVRLHGVLAGYIWLNDDHGWTLNGKNFSQDWQPVAKELAKLTRRDLVAAA